MTIAGAGECQIEASQPGDDNYLAAVPAVQSVLHIVTPPGPGVPTNPGLIFDPQDSELFSAGDTFTLIAATTTQTPVDPQPTIIYVSSTPSICTIPLLGSLEVTMLNIGDCIIVAASAPNSLYSTGGPVAGTINLYSNSKPSETVAVPTLPQPLFWLLGVLVAAVSAHRLQKRSY